MPFTRLSLPMSVPTEICSRPCPLSKDLDRVAYVPFVGKGRTCERIRCSPGFTPSQYIASAEHVSGTSCKLLGADLQGALDWQSLPEARRNHPTTEHLYPLYVALGAGGPDTVATQLHQAVQMGGMSMDAFAFGQAA